MLTTHMDKFGLRFKCGRCGNEITTPNLVCECITDNVVYLPFPADWDDDYINPDDVSGILDDIAREFRNSGI